ncbi:winged helix-turn-helix transcriptional regulator [Halolactibacillus halophilus]|uniref:HTH hxlR-type domain-containing protein n=1 Tax=Halolactibacillus halophilus TaxID=306540 RepID=A0ABQ0VJV1_9BACI|nr:winged helix-turn-helix transcriptional regulator [Halolactibacillus halophilus]GEM01358.1 hypothetical protein HHA03_08900 [Halolactibacillus halophilus]
MLVERDVIPDTPVVIEYALTDQGRSMEPILKSIEQWWMLLNDSYLLVKSVSHLSHPH